MNDVVGHSGKSANVLLTRSATVDQTKTDAAKADALLPIDSAELSSNPNLIYISGDETPRELSELRQNVLRWEGPEVKLIVKKKQHSNAVPWTIMSQPTLFPEPPLPTPDKMLLGLLHDLGHQSLTLQMRDRISFPNILVLSGAGSMAYALAHHIGNLTVVHPSKDWVAAVKNEPLSCKGTILETMKNDKERYLQEVSMFRCFSSVVYRNAPLNRTALPSSSFDVVIVEQGHSADLFEIVAEAQRVSRSNAIIALASYMPAAIVPKRNKGQDALSSMALNRLLDKFFHSSLSRFLSSSERQVIDRFEALRAPVQYAGFPDFQASHETSSVFSGENCSMHADWTCQECLDHVGSWSVVKRVDGFRHPNFMEVPLFRTEFAKAWGSIKRRRRVSFKVVVKTAIVRKYLG